jgi:hypothetical protein
MNMHREKTRHRAFHTTRVAAAALWLGAMPASAWAFQPLITDDTGTQGAGGNQIEVSYNRTVDKLHGSRDVTTEFPVVYTRGVTDTLDLFAGIGHVRLGPEDAPAERGFNNFAVGAKWRFYEDETSKLSVALKPELQVPVSKNRETRGLGTADFSYGLGLLVTKETGFGAVHANLAVDRVNYDDDALNAAERRTLVRLSVAPVWDVSEKWKLALDAGIMTNPDRAERTFMGYAEIGVIYSATKQLDFAVGLLRNLRDGAVSTTFFTVGVTARF